MADNNHALADFAVKNGIGRTGPMLLFHAQGKTNSDGSIVNFTVESEQASYPSRLSFDKELAAGAADLSMSFTRDYGR